MRKLDPQSSKGQGVGDASLEDVKRWVKLMGERGMYKPSTARTRVSALDRITSVLGGDEPASARHVLDNLEEICSRWSRKEGAKPETANTYLSRSRTALSDYFEYHRDPMSFRPRGREPRGEKASRLPAQERKGSARGEPVQPTSGRSGAPTNVAVDREPLRTFPLAGAEFAFLLPEEITVADVHRIACHLATFAKDFHKIDPRAFEFRTRDGNK